MAVLLVVFESVTNALLTLALLLIAPAVLGLMVIFTVVLAPVFTVPKAQFTVAVPVQVPCAGTELTKVTLAGNTSLSVILPALLGPLFCTVSV